MTQIKSSTQPSVIIIGTGFGGIGMAIQLKNAGFTNVTVLEKAARVGGTWRDNTYPGAACDVQSHFYSYSFEPKHDWSRKFGLQHELLGYMEHCVEKYGLGNQIRFNCEVAEAVFDEARNHWTLRLTSGETLAAQVVITATGQLNQPAWPRIEGINDFEGAFFHSARWDHDYDLKNKRIAVIGTIGCKRILISNDWYPAINRPNLDLITDPITKIDATGVQTQSGKHYPVDAIVFGTGFRASEFLSPIRVTGCGGITLNQAWKDGATAFKGITVSKFPNLFMLYGPNTNLAHNSILYMLESQFQYVLGCLGVLQKHPGAAMDVRQDSLERYSSVIQEGLEDSVWSSGCSSWYLDANGKNTLNWPGFTFSYRRATRHVDTADYQFLYPAG